MKALIAYFSASGVTAEKAKAMANATGYDIYEIKPETPYSPADIKWTNPLARCNKEWIKKADIALADNDANIESYDLILLFFPIWYFTAPLIIRSFLKAYNFDAKMILLFATSGGSPFGKTVEHLKKCAVNCEIAEGAVLNGTYSDEELTDLIKKYI